jgi:hypothetical protein
MGVLETMGKQKNEIPNWQMKGNGKGKFPYYLRNIYIK